MSIENANAFLQRIINDQELRNKLEATESKEERIKVAKAEGLDCTEDEWEDVCKELSDEELHLVSGGGMGCWCIPLFGEINQDLG